MKIFNLIGELIINERRGLFPKGRLQEGGGGGGDYSTEVIISSNFPKGGRSFQGEIKRSGCFLRRHGTLADVVIVLCLHVLLAW